MYAITWKYDDCGETLEFESSETYTAAEAGDRAASLAEGGAYDIVVIPDNH